MIFDESKSFSREINWFALAVYTTVWSFLLCLYENGLHLFYVLQFNFWQFSGIKIKKQVLSVRGWFVQPKTIISLIHKCIAMQCLVEVLIRTKSWAWTGDLRSMTGEQLGGCWIIEGWCSSSNSFHDQSVPTYKWRWRGGKIAECNFI